MNYFFGFIILIISSVSWSEEYIFLDSVPGHCDQALPSSNLHPAVQNIQWHLANPKDRPDDQWLKLPMIEITPEGEAEKVDEEFAVHKIKDPEKLSRILYKLIDWLRSQDGRFLDRQGLVILAEDLSKIQLDGDYPGIEVMKGGLIEDIANRIQIIDEAEQGKGGISF